MTNISTNADAANHLNSAKELIEQAREKIQEVEYFLEQEIESLAGRVSVGAHEIAKEHSLEILQEIAADNEQVESLITEINGLTES